MKTTRAERKARQRAMFADLDSQRAQEAARKAAWVKSHPVSAGLIPVGEYREPAWKYVRQDGNEQ